jgi:hypothetical protein
MRVAKVLNFSGTTRCTGTHPPAVAQRHPPQWPRTTPGGARAGVHLLLRPHPEPRCDPLTVEPSILPKLPFLGGDWYSSRRLGSEGVRSSDSSLCPLKLAWPTVTNLGLWLRGRMPLLMAARKDGAVNGADADATPSRAEIGRKWLKRTALLARSLHPVVGLSCFSSTFPRIPIRLVIQNRGARYQEPCSSSPSTNERTSC